MVATKIDVLDTDIQNGMRNDSSKCAVSVAIARTFPDVTRVKTDIQTIKFTRAGKRYTYLTPRSVMEYIVAFDAGDEDIEPFTVRLSKPHITESPKPQGKARVDAPPSPDRVPRTTPVRIGGRPAPGSRIGKKGSGRYTLTRSYGMRAMRINKQADA